MGVYKFQNMAGTYNQKDDVVKCINCMKQKDFDNLKEDEILTYDKIDLNFSNIT